jgi:hypothetical protein
MKRILDQKTFLSTRNSEVSSINEVFTNDIPWGDSLVGRLINSIARKGKIAFNVNMIDGVFKRLQRKFDEINEFGTVEISKSDKSFIAISTLFGTLKENIDKGEDIDLIITNVRDLILEFESSDYKKKDDMIGYLEKFLEFLEDLKKGGESESDSGEENEETKKNEFFIQTRKFLEGIVQISKVISSETQPVGRSKNPNLQNFLQVLAQIEENGKPLNLFLSKDKVEKSKIIDEAVNLCDLVIQDFKKEGNHKEYVNYSKIKNRLLEYKKLDFVTGNIYTYKTKDGKKINVKLISKTHDVRVGPDKKWMTKDDQKVKDLDDGMFSVIMPDKEGNYTSSSTQFAVPASSLSESLIFESNEVSPVKGNAAWKKIREIYSKSELQNFQKDLEDFIKFDEDDSEFESKKENVIKIGKQVISNVNTTAKPLTYDELVKEDLTQSQISNDLPKSISLFLRAILPLKENMGLLEYIPKIKDFTKNVLDSFSKMSEFLVKDTKSSDDPKKDEDQKKQESSNLSWENFLLVLEKSRYQNQIIEKFNEIFTDEVTKDFQVSEAKKVELEKKVKSGEKAINLSDLDLIDIVRIFRRAWRLHTPGSIPSGRSGGKVSISVFNEYEYAGGGSPGTATDPGAGPYRNKKTWDKWYNLVSQLTTDKKYRKIFDEGVPIKFGGSDEATSNGRKFLAFMTDMLEDTEQYTSSGKMSDLLFKYFGIKVDVGGKEIVPGDRSEVEKAASGITKTDLNFSTKSINSEVLKKYKDFLVRIRIDDKNPQYLRILKTEDQYFYAVSSLKTFLDKTNVNIENLKEGSSGDYNIIKFKVIDLVRDKKINGWSVNVGKGTDPEEISREVKEMAYLVNKSDGELFVSGKYQTGDSNFDTNVKKYSDILKNKK